MITVYLAGPMEDCDISTMTCWRNEVKFNCKGHQIRFLDPTRRVAHLRRELKYVGACPRQEDNLLRRTMLQDLRDIDASDVVFANLQSDKRMIGTSMELMYAYTKRIPVITCTEIDSKTASHPFIRSVVTENYYFLDEAIEALRNWQ